MISWASLLVAGSQIGWSCFDGVATPTAPGPGMVGPGSPCPRVTIGPETMQAYPMLPDVLGTLKVTLDDDTRWPQGANTIRQDIRHQMARILEDPRLVFEYSPPLVPVAHLGTKVVAAQTIDGNRIRLSRFAGGPSGRDPTVLAQTVAHELLHVFQVRHQGKALNSFFEPAWELPAYALEAQLPAGAFAGALVSCTAAPPPQAASGPCRPRRTRPGPAGQGEWVAWMTGAGWLRVGREQDFQRPQRVSDDIWGGTSTAPLVKTRIGGPWWSREQALEEITAELQAVTIAFFPTATPKEVTQGTYRGQRLFLRLVYGEPMQGYVGRDYAMGEEVKSLLANGISPRVVFGAPRYMIHARRGTPPSETQFWSLVGTPPKNGAIELPDGTGGTFGYRVDVVEGPFIDGFQLYPAMARANQRTIGEYGSSRTISLDWAVEPYVDHGTPLCSSTR